MSEKRSRPGNSREDKPKRSGGKRRRPGSRDAEKPKRSGGKRNRPGSRDADRSGKPDSEKGKARRPYRDPRSWDDRSKRDRKKQPPRVRQEPHLKDEIRINKFIAHSGFCSRREADEYIEQGQVYVNDKKVEQLGIKVRPDDKVVIDGQTVSLEPFVYILLNKGKDTISTTDDEKDRNTVLDAVEKATGYRVYPVGRLDRDTMGLILLTNDGDLAHRLMHPSYKVKKVYEVTTDRTLTDAELRELAKGIELEDGPARPEKLQQYAHDPKTLEITVVEGRKHLIKRMISHFGAEVVKLKRIRYAGLTDKDLRVTRWRYLKQKEVNNLRRQVKLKPLDFLNESV